MTTARRSAPHGAALVAGRRALLRGLAATTLFTPFIARAHGGATVTDAIGRTVTVEHAPKRIILGFNYEEFTAVAGPAGWERVVGFGRSMWEGWRPSIFRRYKAVIPGLDGLPEIGSTDDNSWNLEKVLSLRPDLVILPDWSFTTLKEQVAKLEALGIPILVIDYNAQIPERHAASTRAIGAMTGNQARAEELAAMYLARVADIQKRAAAGAAAAGKKPKVYFELGQAGASTVGNTYWKGMWGRILDLLAADNIAAGKIPGAWGPLNPEYVLAANPDAIFIAGSSWVNKPNAVITGFDADLATTRRTLAPYAQRQGWPELAAIKAGDLHAIEHGLCRALFDYTAMTYIAKQLYPAQFADIDPVAELRKYHERFLPVAFEGTWMARLS